MADVAHFYPTTVVAIDKDKTSQYAVKWVVNNLLASNPTIVLVHVRTSTASPLNYIGARDGVGMDPDVVEMFRSYRVYCARKGMKVREVILDDSDVSKALIEYTNHNQIANIVVGSSNRNAITRKFMRSPDVPTTLLKSAPDFCTVYVILKGKMQNVRTAKSQLPNIAAAPQQSMNPSQGVLPVENDESTATSRTARGGGFRAPIPTSSTPERRSFERNRDLMKTPPTRDSGIPLSTGDYGSRNLSYDNLDLSVRMSNGSDDFDFQFQSGAGFQTADMADSFELSTFGTSSPLGSTSPVSKNRDLEAEMKRLKLELKQTMDMYSTACKEAITAKQKAKELHQWKIEKIRRVDEAKQAEEEALAIAEVEKARCRAAIEAAQRSQRVAEMESKKRIDAELAVKLESEEKNRVLEALAQKDIRYRKYSIGEIENATDNFCESLKIGEGGYGPVYRATLEHTPVAIKLLRPDAEEGRKQFQQEVEVLSLIRHPNMVLLLGACPEYGCLIYEYMDFGSLDDRLFRRGNTPTIPWSIRFKIAADIATGLLFLHQTKPEPLVHRDLKPGNILVDRNYTSKISDVGLSRLVPPSVADSVTQYRMTSTAGTFCYIDPEYQQTGMLGIKSDIYSLGILLLQIITAKPPMGLTHYVEQSIERGTFKEILDPAINEWPVEEALSFAKLALGCAELRRKDRPDLRTVILPELDRLRSAGREWELS